MKTSPLFWVIALTIIIIVTALPLAAEGEPVFAPFVSRLDGTVDENTVRLSWTDSRDVRGPVYIYRSTAPFIEPELLLPEITPAEIPYGVQAYVDETAPAETVYYFAVASDENGLKYDYPIINNNTVIVSKPAEDLAEITEIPSGEPDLKKARVFVRDLSAAGAVTGAAAVDEERALASIVRGSFVARDWAAAREELSQFLTLPLKSGSEARARFYLGQCSYFLREPEEGLFEFTAFQAMYPAEASGWIEASLDMMGD